MKNLYQTKTDMLGASACDDECPVRMTASIIDGKWTTLIIRDLLGGKKRFSELQRSLLGISPKVLSARLKFLEEKGMLGKTIYPCVPPKTEYELTSLGGRLELVISAMMVFGESMPESDYERAPRNGMKAIRLS